MKNGSHSDSCDFCDEGFDYMVKLHDVTLLMCECCTKELYQKIGRLLVPKGIPNMIMRATNNSTIKRIEDFQIQNEDKSVDFDQQNKKNVESPIIKRSSFRTKRGRK